MNIDCPEEFHIDQVVIKSIDGPNIPLGTIGIVNKIIFPRSNFINHPEGWDKLTQIVYVTWAVGTTKEEEERYGPYPRVYLYLEAAPQETNYPNYTPFRRYMRITRE
jgi:hypothetical protein